MTTAFLLAAVLAGVGPVAQRAKSWSNGGPSARIDNPDYGTHDWIAQHALDWIPSEEKQYLVENLGLYLYGSELPDFADATGGDDIGDKECHHVYYRSSGQLQDQVGAERAQSMFSRAVDSLRSGNLTEAAKWAGAMTHYISDLGVFGHVMGGSTDWGVELHHADYEDYVEERTDNYASSFNSFLVYDGGLAETSAYDIALRVAHDTTFDDSEHGHGAAWMDANYDWTSPAFANRAGESLSVSMNAITDALHNLWIEAGRPTQGLSQIVLILAVALILAAVSIIIVLRTTRHPRRPVHRGHSRSRRSN